VYVSIDYMVKQNKSIVSEIIGLEIHLQVIIQM